MTDLGADPDMRPMSAMRAASAAMRQRVDVGCVPFVSSSAPRVQFTWPAPSVGLRVVHISAFVALDQKR
jgi:hypothetical protein